MSKGENMVERCARAIYERSETYPPYALTQMNGKIAEDYARAVMDELWAHVDLALLDFDRDDPEEWARGHEHAKSVVRTILSQPNDEGGGR